MKNIICLTMVSLLCICCARENTARLEFEVTDPAASTVVVVCHTDINEIALDENGRGTCILDGIDAAYARVYYGPGMKRIYVEKGDKAKISFQGNDFNGTFLYKGRKAPAVEYLNTVELTAMPDETYALDFGEFLSKTENKIDDAMKLLHARDLAGTGNFIEMEKGRITYSYANTLLMYPVAHVLMARNPMYRPDEAYYDVIRSYDRPLIMGDFTARMADPNVRSELDWQLYQLQRRYLDYQVNIGNRIIEMLTSGDPELQAKAPEMSKPKTLFQNLIDNLFNDTGKKINRKSNEILFEQEGDELTPYQLSSGEKQMLVILLTVLVQDNQPYALFMDEPEISLHVEWQQQLILLIRQLNPNAQIILTTHSPAVIMNGWIDAVTEVSDITLH